MNWYLKVMKNYASFRGMACRQEFWMFSLFNTLAAIMVDVISATLLDEIHGPGAAVYLLFTLLPWLGVSIRRLHDTGRSGWWMLIVFMPVIGALVFLAFACQGSQTDENKHRLKTGSSVKKIFVQISPKILISAGVVIQAISIAVLPDVFFFIGSVFIMLGMASFAQARSRNKLWCLLGLVPFFGLFILAFLQDENTGKALINDRDNLSFKDGYSFLSFHQHWFSWGWMPVLWITSSLSLIALNALIGGTANAYVFITLMIALPLTYFCITILVNRTSVCMDTSRLYIQHGPLPWRKGYHVNSNDIISTHHKHRCFKAPSVIKGGGLKTIVEEYFTWHEVWIQTGSGSQKIIRFRDQSHALALIDEMKKTLNITAEQAESINKEASLPPKTGRYI